MDLVKSQLEDTLKLLRDMKTQTDATLDNAPPGVLTCQKRANSEQLMHMFFEGDRRIRRGINKDEDLQRQLAQKEFAQKAAAIIEKNTRILKRAMDQMDPFDLEEIVRSMPAAYLKLPEDYFFDREHHQKSLHLSNEENARIERHRAWGKETYQASDYRPEWKKHKTSRGLKMRSKSEVLIMERLYHYEIDVRYEQEWIFGKDTIAPDFTFEAEDGQLFCWEHLGMMDDARYAANNYNKLMKYYNHGFVLGKNLVISSDLYGTIDMKLIDFIIQNEIIPRL